MPGRKAIDSLSQDWKPEWAPPAGDFSAWHYFVLERDAAKTAFSYAQPVVILAESAGAPQSAGYPLRLRPMNRAHAAELYALLEAENPTSEGAPGSTAPNLGPVPRPSGTFPGPQTAQPVSPSPLQPPRCCCRDAP